MDSVSDSSGSHGGPLVANTGAASERLVLDGLSRDVSCNVPKERFAPRYPDGVVLRLEDLVTDERGNVFVSVGNGLHTVILETDARVISRGIVASTDAQLDGRAGEFTYLSFDVGMTVYIPADLDILLSAPKD